MSICGTSTVIPCLSTSRFEIVLTDDVFDVFFFLCDTYRADSRSWLDMFFVVVEIDIMCVSCLLECVSLLDLKSEKSPRERSPRLYVQF